MAEDGDIDIEGDFDFKIETPNVYDTNELPSKSANLLPEYTNPAWMLEQGWTMDSCVDEKSKATIEKMLLEEQYYLNCKTGPRQRPDKSCTRETIKPVSHKQPWNEEEKQLFLKGMEMFGRSWSKIGRLIPTRTTLQVKNYAQQYFKQLAKKTMKDEKGTAPSNDSESSVISDPLKQVLVSVTTGQTTMAIPTVSSPKFCDKWFSGQTTGVQYVNRYSVPKVKVAKNNRTTVPRRPASAPKLGHRSSTITSISFDTLHDRTPTKTSIGPTLSIPSTLDVIPSSKQLQLSPTLEDKLASSTGIIENLDKFCAVADIISSSSLASESQEDEEVDIDIENDDDNDENPVLKSRSASPNSVYERLLKAANIKNKEVNQRDAEEGARGGTFDSARSGTVTKYQSSTTGQVLSKENVEAMSQSIKPQKHSSESSKSSHAEGSHDSRLQDVVDSTSVTSEVVSESSEEWSTESNSSVSTDNFHQTERHISNTIVLSNGEIVEFPVPTSEHVLEPKVITEEEKKVHLEFFDGRASKTPERYLKIRNFILDSWKKCKPNYLNKTSVRPGLRNCGDVNCIGRIHSYLESIGAINYGCDQVYYKQAAKVPVTGYKERFTRESITQISFSKLEAMRPRKRRIRDAYGHWVDEKELQGKTIEHKEGYEEFSKPKAIRYGKSNYDPFKLVPCVPFSAENPPPFTVEVFNAALVTMDMHSHISKTEVIGMLGGQYLEETNKLVIFMAVPCNSVSTGMQCEMDPVSQTQASEEISDNHMSVVGWYHSHPTFAPNPSVRDIETQLKFQEWFSKGGSKFVGVIVSPYDRHNVSLCSEFQCLTIGDRRSDVYMCNTPHSFNYEMLIQPVQKEDMKHIARNLAEKYAVYSNRVELLGTYRVSTQMICLDKMLESIRDSLDPSDSDVEDLLKSIREIFVEVFTGKKPEIIDPDIISDTEDGDFSFCSDSFYIHEEEEIGSSSGHTDCSLDIKSDSSKEVHDQSELLSDFFHSDIMMQEISIPHSHSTDHIESAEMSCVS